MFLLFAIVWTLFQVFVLISVAYTLIKSIFREVDLVDYFYMNLWTIDQSLGTIAKHWFNDWMVKPNGQRFGNPDHTISHDMGVNLKRNTLYPFGKFIAFGIDFIFWAIGQNKWRRHCLDAAKNKQ